MPDIIGQILQRLDALETAVHGRASEHFDRKLFKPQVALRMAAAAGIRGGGSRRWSNTTVRLPPSQS
jgi:hypothetical protein